MTSQSSELNYTPVMANHSAPRMSRVYPLNIVAPLNIDDSAKEVSFELPNKVYNLCRSNLEFVVDVGSAGVDTQNVLYLSGVPIDRISLFSREGVMLVDQPNFQHFSKAVTPHLTCRENSKNNDGWDGTDAPLNGLKSFSYNALTDESGLASIQSGGTEIANDNSFSSMDKIAISAINGTSKVRVRLPLKEIHHSLLSVDRVMYFGQSLILRIHFAPRKGFGFRASDASITTAPLANLAQLSSVTLTDIKVNLAVETSPDIIEGLVARVQSAGLQVMTPYTYGYLFTSGNGATSMNVQQRLNAGHGQRLLLAMTSHFDNGTNKETAGYLDNSNIKDGVITKVKRYQTSMDNNNLTEYVIDVTKGEDFELHKSALQGSTVKDVVDYEENRVHIDSWRGGKSCSWRERDATEVDGLSLESERIYNFNVEQQEPAPNGYRVFSWYVCQRTLTIQSNGQIIMS